MRVEFEGFILEVHVWKHSILNYYLYLLEWLLNSLVLTLTELEVFISVCSGHLYSDWINKLNDKSLEASGWINIKEGCEDLGETNLVSWSGDQPWRQFILQDNSYRSNRTIRIRQGSAYGFHWFGQDLWVTIRNQGEYFGGL